MGKKRRKVGKLLLCVCVCVLDDLEGKNGRAFGAKRQSGQKLTQTFLCNLFELGLICL